MPQLLITNATIHSSRHPFATALLVDNGVVAWVGDTEVARSIAPNATVRDAEGALVTPAFVDAHVHVLETAITMRSPQLSPRAGVTTREQVKNRIAEAAAGWKPGEHPITFLGYDDSGWPEQDRLSWQDIDQVAGAVPVYVPRADLHSALGSTALLRWAELNDANTPRTTPLRDDDHVHVRQALQVLDPSFRDELYRSVLARCASLGVVEVHENSAPGIDTRAGLARLIEMTREPESGLPLVVGYRGEAVSSVDQVEALATEIPGLQGLAGDLSVDGSFGSRSALLRQDYSDDAGNRGTQHLSVTTVADHIRATSLAGVQGGFHVIGDGALDVVVQALQQVAGESPQMRQAIRRAGHRLEHVELLDDNALATCVDLSVMISAQPAFDAWWGGPSGMYAQRLGQQRALATTPIRSMMASGVTVGFGSDSPVTPINPWDGVRAAVWHTNSDQRISARAAFRAHTRAGHRLRGEVTAGEITVGAPAHLALWDAPELGVQAENDGRSSWSTDARSGTPLLPYLAQEGLVPTCLATWRSGELIYEAP